MADNDSPDQSAGLATSESLEGPDTPVQPVNGAGPAPSSDPSSRLSRWRKKFNIYLLLLILVVVVALIITLIAFLQGRQHTTTQHIQTQGLSQSTLDQLASGDVSVGTNQSVLNVQSSAVFAGQVLIRQNLQVAGNLQIGGTVALNNIAVAGTSQFGQVNVNKNLAVAGDTALQGSLTTSKSLQVNGNGTFSGPLSAPQITAGSLQLNGDLVLTHHITAGGATPSRSNGPALGSGGSASISGSDTAGSVSINTGTGPAAGCFISITFNSHFNATPHILITPVGSAAGGLAYYINRSSTSFSICDASAPPATSSFGFDYFVLD